MESKKIGRKTYSTRNIGNYPEQFIFNKIEYKKIEDLRYGINPHQTAAFYKPMANDLGIFSTMKLLKSGKSGLSETNIEDISAAFNILKYFDKPSGLIMKHLNPSGVAMQKENEDLVDIYRKARDCDARAFFGGVVGFNAKVDKTTAEEIMGAYVEVVAAPSFSPEALSIFEDFQRFKVNRDIRIVEVANTDKLPKFVGDETYGIKQVRVLADGTLIISDPFLTHVRGADDFDRPRLIPKKRVILKAKLYQLQTRKMTWFLPGTYY
jgi:phosphoribosylaminoimidazolecarboxamide formyltransferase/IMP cyclohydrolase